MFLYFRGKDIHLSDFPENTQKMLIMTYFFSQNSFWSILDEKFHHWCTPTARGREVESDTPPGPLNLIIPGCNKKLNLTNKHETEQVSQLAMDWR